MATKLKAGCGFIRTGFLALLAIIGLLRPALAADTNAALETNGKTAEAAAAGTQDSLRSYLLIQEQLRKTQLAIEKNRQDAEAAAASNSLAVEERLRSMENTLANDRLEQSRRMERSEQIILIATCAFAAIGFVVLMLAAFLQWTTVHRLAAAAASLSAVQSHQVLGMGESPFPSTRALEQSNTRFLALIERLEQRIHELEASVKPPPSLPDTSPANGGSNGPATESSPAGIAPDKASLITLLLSKSQTLLKLDKPEASLGCVDEVLAYDPGNADALVKKGVALERLQRFAEAIQCYDRAIAQDNSTTMAYLYKGSLLNRTERYGEALACYEQALNRAGKTSSAKTS